MAQKNRTMAFIWFEVAAFRLSVSPEDHNENPAPFFPPPSKKRFLFGPGFIAWVQDFSDILLWPCRCGGKRREVRKAMAKKMAGLCAVFAKVKGFRELKKTLEDYDEEMDEL